MMLARKGGHASTCPLAPGVGEALVEYLQHGRIPRIQRAVFPRADALHTPNTYAAIGCCGSRSPTAKPF